MAKVEEGSPRRIFIGNSAKRFAILGNLSRNPVLRVAQLSNPEIHTLTLTVVLSVFKTPKDPFWDQLCLADYIWVVEQNICNKLNIVILA